jgi:hypothetical protein
MDGDGDHAADVRILKFNPGIEQYQMLVIVTKSMHCPIHVILLIFVMYEPRSLTLVNQMLVTSKHIFFGR